MNMSQRMRDSLDRHITGNYGEDQFQDEIWFEEGEGWFFPDEEGERRGPYESKGAARQAKMMYESKLLQERYYKIIEGKL